MFGVRKQIAVLLIGFHDCTKVWHYARQVISVFIAYFAIAYSTRSIRHATPPASISTDMIDGVRFGVPESTRRKIFQEIAIVEPENRRKGTDGFPGDLWSSEDHRCNFEHYFMRTLASRYALSLTQIYLILDEAIREKWLGPDGKVLTPTTVPLKPRQR